MRSFLQKISLSLAILSVLLCANASAEALSPISKAKINKMIVAKTIKNRISPINKSKMPKLRSAKAASTGTFYNYPGVLPYDGNGAYMSFNTVVNNYDVAGKEDYIFQPKDSAATFLDGSTNSPSSYLWNAPGATPATAQTQDLEVVYGQEGRFDFPTLTAGGSSYTASGSIKVGGKAEICSFNSLMLDSTYIPYDPQWGQDKGFVAGSNGWNDIGYGNLIFLGQDSATVESVSVYIRANPTAANKDNKVKLTIYETGDDADGYFKPNAKALATSELKISDMMPGSSSVTGITYVDSLGKKTEVMGLANFKFDAPVKVGSYFFAAVENFGNDLAKKDSFCIMMNPLDPIPADSFKYVASNSSWSLSETTTGTHEWFGLYYYLDFNPVLMICPVVNYNYKTTGINSATLNNSLVTRLKNGFTVSGASEGEKVSVYNLSGQNVMSGKITNQRQNFIGLNKGIYMIKVGNKNSKVAIY